MDGIPPIGLGTFRLKGEAVRSSIREAISLGYRHIDTAGIYHNEEDIGEVLQELYNTPSNSSNKRVSRQDLWLTSKVSPYDMKSPRQALLKSLSALQTPYLDLYLIHWPALARKPAASPINKQLRFEAWKVLNEAKQEGLVRNIGVSNFTVAHIQELVDESEFGFKDAWVQMEIHPWYWRDAATINEQFKQHRVKITGYALLAEGKLLLKEERDAIDEIADRLVISRVQVVLAWAMRRDWGVLVRSVDRKHLTFNLDAIRIVDYLTLEDCEAIEGMTTMQTEEKRCWDPRFVK
ncbi:NADP-dependent oxidoreductase domain-containing protein [Tricladium varicosporioides]|nr:NADP-dependent oxidoreductase domain-containing protein [Hymenoscyphus varicosporioides]